MLRTLLRAVRRVGRLRRRCGGGPAPRVPRLLRLLLLRHRLLCLLPSWVEPGHPVVVRRRSLHGRRNPVVGVRPRLRPRLLSRLHVLATGAIAQCSLLESGRLFETGRRTLSWHRQNRGVDGSRRRNCARHWRGQQLFASESLTRLWFLGFIVEDAHDIGTFRGYLAGDLCALHWRHARPWNFPRRREPSRRTWSRMLTGHGIELPLSGVWIMADGRQVRLVLLQRLRRRARRLG